MGEKIWISAKTVKHIDQAIPDCVYPFEMWWNEKIVLHGRFKEGVDYKQENDKYFLSPKCEEKLRQEEVAGVMGKSSERFERRHDPPQQKYAITGDEVWDEFIRW